MHIPIKDASLHYAREANLLENVGFFKNVKLPEIQNMQGIAAKTLIAFSLLGAGAFTLNAIHSVDKEQQALLDEQRTSFGKVTQNNSKEVFLASNTQKESKEVFLTSDTQYDLQNTQEHIGLNIHATAKLQKRLSSIAGFKLPEDLTPNNYPKAISEMQLNKGEYYLALVSMAEGFSPTIKPDNKGYFIGFGWNLTLNSIEDNEEIAKSIGLSKNSVNILKNMSHQSDKNVSIEQLNSVSITPQQGMQAAYILGEKIRMRNVIPGIQRVLMKHRNLNEEDSKVAAVDTFNSLSRYEQDLLVYHGYKAGNQFLTFKNLVLKVVDYAATEGLDKIEARLIKKEIVKELDYSYQHKGKKIIDKRAQQITSAMFLGPDNFAKEMGLKINPDKKIAPPAKI